MRRLGPGIYDDGQGGLHLDMTELLAASGYADTPENRVTLLEAVNTTCGAVPVEVTDEAIPRYRCPRCGAVSFNPHDIAQRYCGACHQFEQT